VVGARFETRAAGVGETRESSAMEGVRGAATGSKNRLVWTTAISRGIGGEKRSHECERCTHECAHECVRHNG
jgi:hypothetical protein